MAVMANMRHEPQAAAAPVYVNVVQSVVTEVGGKEMKKKQGISFMAALLSLLVPGLGQLYRGRVFAGLMWFVLTGLGYVAFIIPGLILHLLCVCSAFFG